MDVHIFSIFLQRLKSKISTREDTTKEDTSISSAEMIHHGGAATAADTSSLYQIFDSVDSFKNLLKDLLDKDIKVRF